MPYVLRRVKPRICICCGEPIALDGNLLSRNPNMCASCSSFEDGMEDSAARDADALEPTLRSESGAAHSTSLSAETVEATPHEIVYVP